MVPPKPSGVIGEGSDTGKDGVTVRMEGHVQILGVTHPSSPPSFIWLFGLVWEKPAGKKQGGSSFPSPTHVDFFPSGPQIWFSPEEALRRGRKRCDLFTSFALEVSGVHWIWRSR